MSARRSQPIAVLVLAAVLAIAGMRWGLDSEVRRRRPALGASVPAPVADDLTLSAARPAEPVPLRFGWPAPGRVRVDATHLRDGERSHESFLLEWRALSAADLFVEAHPLADAAFDPSPPGPTRSSGTALTPVQAVVSREGRFVCTPGIDGVRAVWERVQTRRDMPVPEPLAERWNDWVERWVGLALAAGETRSVESDDPDARVSIRCASADIERVRLEYRLERGRASSPAAAACDVVCALERTVEAELDPSDMRPLGVRSSSRWTWSRGAAVIRVLERESRYVFDWTPRVSYMPVEVRSAELPLALESWALRRWPWISDDDRRADVEWWRGVWSELSPPRRAMLLAGARAPGADFGFQRTTRRDWLELRPTLERAWSPAEPTGAPRYPVRVWVENGPPETTVDLLFVGDGYTAEDLAPAGRYWMDVQRIATRLFEEPPFSWYRSWFNVRAVFVESEEAGCDRLPERDYVTTALNVSLKDGHLGIGNTEKLRDLARQVGTADVLFVMVNADDKAGTAVHVSDPLVRGGERCVPMFTARAPDAHEVAAHELGHSFGRLADEYVNDERAGGFHANAPNVAARHQTEPWSHFRDLTGAEQHGWRHEGAFYRSKGWFRPWERCRMNDSSDPFCPVCCESLARAIFETCGIEWDDAAYHRARPLELWDR